MQRLWKRRVTDNGAKIRYQHNFAIKSRLRHAPQSGRRSLLQQGAPTHHPASKKTPERDKRGKAWFPLLGSSGENGIAKHPFQIRHRSLAESRSRDAIIQHRCKRRRRRGKRIAA
jgi:hypothetical protein